MIGGLECANAGTVYTQDFTGGTSDNQIPSSSYWNDPTGAHGYYTDAITQSSGTIFGGIFGNSIPVDVTGSGYFLFEGTGGGSTVGSIIFQSASFAVAQNTNYNVSFYVTNADTINLAALQPELSGTLLGSPVSAVGTYTTNGWQQFTFSWNSGSNTSTSFILNDFQTNTTGNDFGVDDFSVSTSAVPEPATLLLLGTGLAALMGFRRRASKRT
jgi:hypothetical protein